MAKLNERTKRRIEVTAVGCYLCLQSADFFRGELNGAPQSKAGALKRAQEYSEEAFALVKNPLPSKK